MAKLLAFPTDSNWKCTGVVIGCLSFFGAGHKQTWEREASV